MRLPVTVTRSAASRSSTGSGTALSALTTSATRCSVATLAFAMISAARAGSAIRDCTSWLSASCSCPARMMKFTASSYCPSWSSPEMVCSRLVNSCACARSVSVALRLRSSSRSSEVSSVWSRSVVTEPTAVPRTTTGIRLSTSTRASCTTTASGPPTPSVSRSASRSPTLAPQRPPGRVRRQAEQPQRLVVGQRHPAGGVEPDQALLDAVQHRLAVLDQAGDLARLEAERLAFEPPGQQQRPGHTQERAQQEVRQQVRRRGRDQLRQGRVRLAGDHEPQHARVARVEDRLVRHQEARPVLDDAEPAATGRARRCRPAAPGGRGPAR